MIDSGRLLDEIAEAAREAGEAIIRIVRQGFEVEAKRDSSPVTDADRAAEAIILAALARATPGVPVIAEEEVAAGRIPAHEDTYFLVDPLDGTKEFVRGGDDYTVNIGLIERGAPALGVVFAPATGRLYGGDVTGAAWVDEGSGRQEIRTRPRGQQLTAVAADRQQRHHRDDFQQPLQDHSGHRRSERDVGASDRNDRYHFRGHLFDFLFEDPDREYCGGRIGRRIGWHAATLRQARLYQPRVRCHVRLEGAPPRPLSRAVRRWRRLARRRLGPAPIAILPWS